MAETGAIAELVAEKRKLKKSLFRFDMIFFTICAIVALDTIGQSSSYGAQAVFWLIVSGLTFLVPYGLITAELGAAFPTEGATYDWVRLAYGHFAGAVVSVLYWLSNPIWLGGTLTATTIAALDALWGSSFTGNQGAETVIGFLFIWGAVIMNILSLRYMKWVPNLGGILRLALLAFFALLVVVSGVSHGFHGTLAGFFPTDTTVLIGVIGVIVFQWIGFELQTNASEEMENPQKDIPRAVYVAGIISFLGYAIPILGVVLILSSDQLSNVAGFVSAYQFASTSIFGAGAPFFNHLAAIAMVFVLLSSGTTWLMGSDRLMAIGALAGSGPKQLGYFSARFGTPIVVNVLSGVISTIFMFITFFVTGGGLHGYFAAVIGLVISTTTFSYILIFPALITLRRKYPNVPRPFVVPGGNAGAWISVILTTFWVTAATVFALWPGLLTSAWSADYANVNRATFEIYTFVTVAFLIVIAVVFWAVGRGYAVHAEPTQMTGTVAPAPAPGV